MTAAVQPQDVQAAFAWVLVDEWVRAGITDVVACPGSRSTPLLVAVAEAAERGALRLHVLLDERAAGYFALGLARASGRPAPVVTTSGTAAVELHPAVVEAHCSGVPLLAVTADRPPELQDCGAPQTISQVGLFGDFVRWQANPGAPELAAQRSWRAIASRSVAEARGGPHRPGPVHLNLAFREPLLGSAAAVLGPSTAGRAEGRPWHRVSTPPDLTASPELVGTLARSGEKGLIIAGEGAAQCHDDAEAVRRLSAATAWPVLADPLSGCRRPGAVGAADALLRSPAVRGWQPEIVVRLGAPWASRVLNEWLGELTCAQVLVDPGGTWSAPDRLPAEVVVASPGALCRDVAQAREASAGESANASATRGAWSRQWALAERLAQGAVDAALAGEEGLTEPAVARAMASAVPGGSTIFLSSSMPVRDMEWWAKPRAGVRWLANRGANGIDGVVATALGVAVAAPRGQAMTSALVGDLAFLYDAGTLLGAAQRDVDLDIVVVDNDGGGIFNFLPQADAQPRERFERLWGTPHGADIAAITRAYGVAVEEVPDLRRLTSALAGSQVGKGLRVLVAKTDRAANVAVHRRLHSAVAAALTGLG